MKKIFIISFFVFISLNSSGASDKIYSWVDEEGIRHFSDSPTYDENKESKGTEQFLIDYHGNQQPIEDEEQISADRKEKTLKNRTIHIRAPSPPKIVPSPKSESAHLNLNFLNLYKLLIPLIYPFLLIIALLIALKFILGIFSKGIQFKILKNFLKNITFHKPNRENIKKQSSNRNSSEFRGFEGEQIIIDLLYKSLDREKYHFFNDVTLADNEGTTQIDHIIVSQYGIFIVETKNMKGSIYGNPYQKNWTQWLADGKHPFQNPFRQNYRHKKCIEKILESHANVYFDVIVFIEGATFPKGMPENVFYPPQLIEFIKSKNQAILSTEKVDQIVSTIDTYRINPSFETDRRHRENLRNANWQKAKS